jgi:potassium/hydrogen antiporter
MDEIANFGEIILVVASGFVLALFGRTLTERFAIPSAALFLLAAAAVSDLIPSFGDAISFVTVERIGVVALIVILLEGGMRIG